uniref:Uncharacterized protein n=1 Tax=Knipowitschia caucasica TaxID=637954 RepID=A0AAV2LQR0_KNICA
MTVERLPLSPIVRLWRSSGHQVSLALTIGGFRPSTRLGLPRTQGLGDDDLWVLGHALQGYTLSSTVRSCGPGPRQVLYVILDQRQDTGASFSLKRSPPLLDKEAYSACGPLLDPGGFYSIYFWFKENWRLASGFRTFVGLNVFLKTL